jgi:predicted branched-subunit amino acid permease
MTIKGDNMILIITAAVALSVGAFFLFNKVLKIPAGAVHGCCCGNVLAGEQSQTPKE